MGLNNKVYIFGFGEVGRAIAECVKEASYEILIDDAKKDKYIMASPETMNPLAIHICFPFSDRFITEVLLIIAVYKPRLVIIESTVPPEVFTTLHKSACPIIHSPVRGSHPDLFDDLHKMPKFVSNEHPVLCKEYYSKWKIPWEIQGTAQELAAGKILSVNWYGMEIAYSQMVKHYCDENGYNFDNVYTDFQSTMSVGEMYFWDEEKQKAVPIDMIPRPTMYPGKIKGHCVISDTEMGRKFNIGNSKLWNWILEENERTD